MYSKIRLERVSRIQISGSPISIFHNRCQCQIIGFRIGVDPDLVQGGMIVAVRSLASALAGVFALGAFPRPSFQAHRNPGTVAAALAVPPCFRNSNQEENE